MTDAIYGARVPADAKGKNFWYKVDSYDEERDSFTHIYQKNMQKTKSLGTYAYDNDGNPRDSPFITFGGVIEKGENLPTGNNHADYIDIKGKYDIVRYFQDHGDVFPNLSKFFIGSLAPHITTDTEVDCESFFSQAGHAAHPNQIELLQKLLSGW